MERLRAKAKIQKAVDNWKRLQEEEKNKANKKRTPKLEKIMVKKKDAQAPLKDIA